MYHSNYCDSVDDQVMKLHNSFPWASIKAGKVVDIGGGSGHISIGLAQVLTDSAFTIDD